MFDELQYAIRRTRRLIKGYLRYELDSDDVLSTQLERYAASQPEHPFLLFEDERYSYAEANAIMNRHAHAYRGLGIERGDVVALMMGNRPGFLWHYFGLHKIGATVSLINTNLRGEVLEHALHVCEPKRVVIDADLFGDAEPGLGKVETDQVLIDGPGDLAGRASFDALAGAASADNPDPALRAKLRDMAAYIYTSGTTGMPKAALVAHYRTYRAGAVWAGAALRYRRNDVLYNCLPLYHSNGLVLATGSVINAGVTMALARRFSTSRFWDDVRKHGATGFIYIGELCRYLLNAPPGPRDTDHGIRVITGNGLRPDIWPEFQRRFGIGRVAEFYGATEGNTVTVNLGKAVGTVGRKMPGMELARWDEENQDFIRGADGFLLHAAVDEPAVLLGRIRKGAEFDGYKDRKASESKVLRDVFEKGDAYFNTGDLMKVDRKKNLHFVDRLGDTFRWKGENVSTTEVQEAIMKWPGVEQANVYGVTVGDQDGRAGMVALMLGEGAQFDAEAFASHVDGALPAYARPVFIRLQTAMETTGTLKLKKTDLQKQGFDPAQVDDPLYARDPAAGYVAVDAGVHSRIVAGEMRV